MNNFPNTFIDKMWLLFIGIITIASILFLMVLIASFKNGNVQAMSSTSSSNFMTVEAPNSPNVITNTLVTGADSISQATGSVVATTNKGIKSVAATTASGGKTVASGIASGLGAASRGVFGGVKYVGNATAKGASFIIGIPVKIVSSISNSSVVSSVIRPSDDMEIPIIDPNSPELAAAINALPPTKKNKKQINPDNSDPSWPINGHITTQFGVPHWPYQRTHSGLDISDYKPSGVTPIKPFRSGRVISVTHSGYGLGNHVVVDHGNGVTSVYAHLASTSVKEGEEVNKSSILGLEGSTGASTGTHLHFEIRVNGKAADPHRFIDGQP